MQDRHKIPLRLKLLRAKNKFRIDSFISFIKPPKKFKGIPKRILLIRNDKIGDAMVTLPVIRNIKFNYPDIKIDVLVSDRNEFIFKNFEHVDDVINFSPEGWDDNKPISKIYKIFLIGSILRFMRFFLLHSLFDTAFKDEIKKIKNNSYDAVVDFVGTKMTFFLSRKLSNYRAGSKIFGLYWLYTYYINTNWVSLFDTDFMSRKIGNALSVAFNLDLNAKDESMPLLNFDFQKASGIKSDIMIHLGGSYPRKFSYEKELELIESLKNYRLIVTDANSNKEFNNLKNEFKNSDNIKFKLYDKITDMLEDTASSQLFLCYDGGQAHFISQYIRTFVIFGPGSFPLWRPYEFADYEVLQKSDTGAIVYKSKGHYGHIAIRYPIWCSPCFDIGCETRPCLGNIKIEFIKSTIDNLNLRNVQ